MIKELETYLATLATWRGATVEETSYYGLLEMLLTAAGAELKPAVRAKAHPHSSGAGIPDLGLFDDNQPFDQKPARGVVEVKPVRNKLDATIADEQVARYLAHYGQVLVTNYYQFALVTQGPNGEVQKEEVYRIAEDENAFWQAAADAHRTAAAHGPALREYLLRVLRRNAPLASPQDVAWMLASYAREAKARIEASGATLDDLARIKNQFEKALGINFQDETAEDFFRSTIVQTLFYGIFSAWVLWHERQPTRKDAFDLWRDTRDLSVPVVREMFEIISRRTHLQPLNIEEVLDWTANALNRVDRAAFFERFNQSDAIQYFYEPFLEAFDPEVRRQLGVWYTPPEVVRYMVARVDAALKDELGIADGLADPNVYVLDPCCGTGAYLVEVLRHIADTLRSREGETLAAQGVQQAIRERVFGFEILPAPFVVAHLQIGTFLTRLGAPLSANQRAGVYLTNALTGWTEEDQPPLDLPELRKEREAAEEVKQKRRILVILGNPPYSSFAGVAVGEERELSNAYRTTKRAPTPHGQGLNELYVRFFRMAERRITEQTGEGIVCYISNFSWLDGLSHTGMREHYLDVFDSITIDCLNGDKFRTGKTTPDGAPDPSIFSTPFNREGIQVGTAVATFIRRPDHNGTDSLRFRHLWGTDKRARLDAEARDKETAQYEIITPIPKLGLPFMPRVLGGSYLDWPKLPELFPAYFSGVQSKRDEVVVDIDFEQLTKRMQNYCDPNVSHADMARILPRAMESTNQAFRPIQTREILQRKGFMPEQIIKFCYRPFDIRWLYYEQETNLLQRRSPEYFPHVHPSNLWIVSQKIPRREWSMPQVIASIGSLDLLDRGASSFPLNIYEEPKQATLLDMPTPGGWRPNLSDDAKAYLERVDAGPEDLFYHALATMHAPTYRVENAGALRSDWPRVPLPNNGDVLRASGELGRQVAALLNVEQPVDGVTRGDPKPEVAGIAELATTGGPADFNLTARWGYLARGAVMPSTGTVTEREDGALDVYLNDTTYWKNVPADVWDYTLGGYQVLKKWLSYRDESVLGRPLKTDEVREFMNIARRIAMLLALAPALDANYQAVAAAHTKS